MRTNSEVATTDEDKQLGGDDEERVDDESASDVRRILKIRAKRQILATEPNVDSSNLVVET